MITINIPYKNLFFWSLFLGCIPITATAQKMPDTLYLSLKQTIEIAIDNSPSVLQAKTQKETSYWDWKTFKSDYLPQLSLDGNLPNFSKDNLPITQPDGSIDFLSVNNINSRVGLSLNQEIPLTGGSISVNSSLARFDNLTNDFRRYNATAVSIRLNQPLFAYNRLLWNKKIEPLKFEESKKKFVEDKEATSLGTTIRYFNLLISQSNYQIAKTNFENYKLLFKIDSTRYDLGTVSKQQLLQIQLQVVNAKKRMSQANLGKKTATLDLLEYIGYNDLQKNQALILKVPSDIPPIQVDEEIALKEAMENRADITAYKRRLLEAESQLARVKAENGFNAELTMSLGLTNADSEFQNLYTNTQDQQTISLGFRIPIADWGRSKSRLKRAQLRKDLEKQSVDLETSNFKREIITEVDRFEMYKQQVIIAYESSNIAKMSYNISKNKFILGKESSTNLNVALNEKDQAIQDYIVSLSDFWEAYYRIRLLTIYDFETSKSLTQIK
ncbi:TolC family protein [Flavivirga rizhaonensis]|uniref:TolC family protein n=1 Tax=Flavivirga rizhaonensis TaxID=2559571 RepID=A0A4S1E256_9FLAO|nr:TolC family protein [Flavivirga rizhaonensis]TGV04706.1 TolC family protein [Flavivirga rizhaonensis]